MSSARRLALGTVQFGQPYGVANKTGQVGPAQIKEILEFAWGSGIDTLDTAIAYGESELRLGEMGVRQWNVISKLPPAPKECADVAGWAVESIEGSLMRLGLNSLDGLLLHNSGELLQPWGLELYQALLELRRQGKIKKIGVSIYGPGELDALWSQYRFDLVQAPFNILDRRLLTSGWMKKLHQAETELHVRSVFLQGLLLMGQDQRPGRFNQWQPLWQEWHHWLQEHELSPVQACLGFAMSQLEIDRVIVGTDSIEQLKQIVEDTSHPVLMPPDNLMTNDLNLINPSLWNSL